MADVTAVKVSISGFDDILNDMQEVSKSEIQKEVTDAMQDIVDTVGKSAKGIYQVKVKSDGCTYESLRWKAYPSKKDHGAYGQVGYYHIPSVMIKWGKDPKKDVPSPIIGYWLEFGVAPHSLARGSRTERKATPNSGYRPAKGQDKKPFHPGVSARNVLAGAYVKNLSFVSDRMDKAISEINNKIFTRKAA